MTDVIQIFKDRHNQWRWRRMAPNGRLIATAGEGFKTKWGAKRAAKRSNPGVKMVVV